MIPKVIKVEDVIVSREITYISAEGIREKATIEIGRPYKMEDEVYFCPYRVGSESYEHIFGSVGIDSFQALDLSMKTIDAELVYWVRKKGGSFEFLGEPGTGFETSNA